MRRIPVPLDRKDQLETPPWLYEWFNRSFHFTHDVACTPQNAKVGYLGPDTLIPTLSWGPRNWLNPPYSNPNPFMQKAWVESQEGKLVVALVKYDHSTQWWNNWVKDKAIQVPVPWRVRFYLDGQPTTEVGNFPSVGLIYLPLLERGE